MISTREWWEDKQPLGKHGEIVTKNVDPAWTQHIIKTADRRFDFQAVSKGATAEHRFIIKNPFVETLRIASVTSSCTCTTPIIEGKKDEVIELQTYEDLAIIAHFNTDRYEGPKNATITVVIDKPYQAEIQLHVRGDIRTDLQIDPKEVSFGEIKDGESASETLDIIYTGPIANWRIIDFKSTNKNLSGEVVSTSSKPGQITTQVKINLEKEMPRGEINDYITLICNDLEGRRDIPIRVRGTVGTLIKVAPKSVFFGFLKPGEPSPRKTVVLRGSEPFRIAKIRCDNPAVEIEYTRPQDATPKMIYAFPIRYLNPKSGLGAPQNGKMQAVVRIEMDDPSLSVSFSVSMEIAQ